MNTPDKQPIKHAIRNRWTDAVLFECDVPEGLESGLRTRYVLEKAAQAGAYLAGAYLAGAYLAGAYLAGANFADAKWRDGIVISKPPIQITGLHWFVTILDAHMQIGCELHSLAEWESFDDARIVAMDGRAAMRFWRAHKDALLAMARGAGRSFEAVAVAELLADEGL